MTRDNAQVAGKEGQVHIEAVIGTRPAPPHLVRVDKVEPLLTTSTSLQFTSELRERKRSTKRRNDMWCVPTSLLTINYTLKANVLRHPACYLFQQGSTYCTYQRLAHHACRPRARVPAMQVSHSHSHAPRTSASNAPPISTRPLTMK